MPLPGSLSFSHFLRGGRFAPTGYWGSSSLALTIGFRSRQADSQCGYPIARLFRHAIFPSPFRVQVGRMTWQVSHSCRLIVRQNDQAVTRRTPRSTISARSSNRNSFICTSDARVNWDGKRKREAQRLPYPARNRRHKNSIPEVFPFVNTEFYVRRSPTYSVDLRESTECSLAARFGPHHLRCVWHYFVWRSGSGRQNSSPRIGR